jgi:uncharacterized protein
MQNKLDAWNENEFSPRLHLIKGENLYLIFDINSLSLFKVNSFTYEIFLQILDGCSPSDLIKKYKIDDAQNIYRILFQNDCRTKAIASNKTARKPVLDRLVLNISNDCNLSCKYCYATHGTYGCDKSFMEEGLALKTVDYFYKIYEEINNIQFFGGEPLLNPHTIEIICAYITEKHVQGKIKKLPVFGIVTNGTIMSPEILRLFSIYDIKLTISIDGPQFIHDYLRGNNTFKEINKNIQQLKNINIGVECTFTNYHLINNFKVSDLMKFFHEKFGLHSTHIPFVAAIKGDELCISDENLKKVYSEATEFALSSIVNETYMLDSYTLRLLRAIIYKKMIAVYCPAGLTTLAVSSQGDIYPCFMFIGKKEFLMGNVLEKDIDPQRLSKIWNNLEKFGKWNNVKCNNCWARSLCFGCLGNDYIVSGSIEDKPNCEFIKTLIESFLLNFSKISDDPCVLSRMINLCVERDSNP